MGDKQSKQSASVQSFASSVDEKQISGNHYKKLDPEPWNVITAWNLGYLDGTALKYIARWRDKGGLDDIRKAIHFLEKFIEVETSKQASAVSEVLKGPFDNVKAQNGTE